MLLRDTNGIALGSFAAPWARDARGRSVPTEYSLARTTAAGYVLTQRVHSDGATFPVTADPKFRWGWVTGTIYFNKSETRYARSYSGSLWAAGAACAFLRR